MKADVFSTGRITPELAAEDLLSKLAGLKYQPKGLVLMTSMIDEPAALVRAIHEATNIPLVGTKTTGVASHESPASHTTAVLMVFGGDDCSVSVGALLNISGVMEVTGEPINDVRGPSFCVTFPDAISASSDKAISKVRSMTGEMPIIGGFSADDWDFNNVQQFFGSEVYRDSCPYMVVSGAFTTSCAGASGITAISPNRLPITISGRSIMTIGGERAYDFYLDKVGDSTLFGEFPIVFSDSHSGRLRCRSPLFPDKEKGVINCGADIPGNAEVSLGSASRHDLVSAAKGAVAQSILLSDEQPEFAIAVSCAARLRRLGSQADEERMVIGNMLKAPFVLGYLYGEIAPGAGCDVTLENNHFVVLTVGGRRISRSETHGRE